MCAMSIGLTKFFHILCAVFTGILVLHWLWNNSIQNKGTARKLYPSPKLHYTNYGNYSPQTGNVITYQAFHDYTDWNEKSSLCMQSMSSRCTTSRMNTGYLLTEQSS